MPRTDDEKMANEDARQTRGRFYTAAAAPQR